MKNKIVIDMQQSNEELIMDLCIASAGKGKESCIGLFECDDEGFPAEFVNTLYLHCQKNVNKFDGEHALSTGVNKMAHEVGGNAIRKMKKDHGFEARQEHKYISLEKIQENNPHINIIDINQSYDDVEEIIFMNHTENSLINFIKTDNRFTPVEREALLESLYDESYNKKNNNYQRALAKLKKNGQNGDFIV